MKQHLDNCLCWDHHGMLSNCQSDLPHPLGKVGTLLLTVPQPIDSDRFDMCRSWTAASVAVAVTRVLALMEPHYVA